MGNPVLGLSCRKIGGTGVISGGDNGIPLGKGLCFFDEASFCELGHGLQLMNEREGLCQGSAHERWAL